MNSNRRPQPLQTLMIESDSAEGPRTAIVRRFATAAGLLCRRCDQCTLQPGGDGQSMCTVAVLGRVRPSEAEDFGLRSHGLKITG